VTLDAAHVAMEALLAIRSSARQKLVSCGAVFMRILQCITGIPSSSGGTSRAVIEMCRAIGEADQAVHVDIATTDFELTDDWHQHVLSRLPSSTNLYVFPESRWLDRGWSLPMARWLWKSAAGYDLLHIHTLFQSTSSVSAWIARRHDIPYIVQPHGTLSPYTFANRKQLLKRVYFRFIDRATIRGAAAVHFTAPQEAAKAARLGFTTPCEVVSLPFSASRPDTALPVAGQDVLFLSRLHPKKGLDLLLSAFAQVVAAEPAARLVIAGSGDPAYEASLRNATNRLGLAKAVTFRGFVEGAQKHELLNSAAVFVLPSHEENFGVAVVEALASQVPVVITRGVDLWPDVMRYESGVVVDTNPAELAQAMLFVLRDPALRRRMAANASRQVRELYAYREVGTGLLDMYRRAIGLTSSAASARVDDVSPA
jgi:glycosyltransferase involved in cell wall biosynthesis